MSALSTRAFDALADDSYRMQNRATQRLNAGTTAAKAAAIADFNTKRPRNIRAEAAGDVGQAEAGFANVAKTHGFNESSLRKYMTGGLTDEEMASPEMQSIKAKLDPNSPTYSKEAHWWAKDAASTLGKRQDRQDAVARMTTPNKLGPSTVPTPPVDPTQPIVSGPPAPCSQGVAVKSSDLVFPPRG
jgi:hypothetical protein